MQRILVILMVVLTAWAVMPGAAEAHVSHHETSLPQACPQCPEMGINAMEQQGSMHDCQHGTGCIGTLLPVAETGLHPAKLAATVVHQGEPQLPSSISVGLEIPPPRG
ncbi:hypothetical protein GI582_20705 [Sulfitobacter sp. BDSS02]|nr:hypothetical protein [Sulfitobacter sp. BDSS02]MBR9851892.1 hypothetical protein [Paracoccaceae bacterium]